MFPIACFPICRTSAGLLALAFALAAAGGEPPPPIGTEQPWAVERAAMPICPRAETSAARWSPRSNSDEGHQARARPDP